MKNIIFYLLLLYAVLPLCARDVEVIVEDIDLGLALEGAIIRSWDNNEYICDTQGKTIITAPDNRQAVVQAAYPGYENGRLIITTDNNSFTIRLRLSGIMENRELVVEAAKPGSSESKTGRSVAVSGRDIAQTAEIGIIEDVMSTVKLLPGVGYAGFFDAMPSIRGGDPGDMMASLDGFYVFNPYFWGGGFSIFDPRMVQSAQLSHGVFSSRYGHTNSGLLDISSKKPSASETEIETAISTSAANMNLSVPIAGRGGILFMGRITYYDPIIALAQQLSKSIESLEIVNSLRVPPYIRSAAVTGNYRFFDNLELHATAFWGMDGIGFTFSNSSNSGGLKSDSDLIFDWTNYKGFITAGLDWNPRSDMLLKLTAGAGFENGLLGGDSRTQIHEKSFSNNFINDLHLLGDLFEEDFSLISALFNDFEPYEYDGKMKIDDSDLFFNVQGRVDYDWELRDGLLLAAGIQEMASRLKYSTDQYALYDVRFYNLDPVTRESIVDSIPGFRDLPPEIQAYMQRNLIVNMPVHYSTETRNNLYTTSAYSLAEYMTANRRFAAELGLRIDHYYLAGSDFSLNAQPAVNPRLNLDFNVLRDFGFIQSFDIGVGTGLFSSLDNNSLFLAEKKYNIAELKPARSWTSVLGARLELPENINFNIEAYYKHIFNRTYLPVTFGFDELDVRPQFNGMGRVWGIDLMLQKLYSRYFDGWLSYSYNWAKNRDPNIGNANMDGFGGGIQEGWYYPSYHRFHYLNLVFNIRPVQRFNIYTRFGFASGLQLLRRLGDRPLSYPVYVPDAEGNGYFIEEYYWPAVRDEKNRTSPSLPLDIKFSIFGKNRNIKANYELYVAIENVLALLYTSRGNTSFNSYTGEIDSGSFSASYEIPIPIPSFGFKISY